MSVTGQLGTESIITLESERNIFDERTGKKRFSSLFEMGIRLDIDFRTVM